MATVQTAEAPTTFGAWLKGYLRQCGEVFKHPKLLLPTLILALVWIILGILQTHVRANLPMKVLNFLTFAQGGLYGGFIGAVGGILGKVVVAAFVNVLIVPLFQGGHPFSNFGSSLTAFKESFKSESSEALTPLFKGIGWALIFYVLFNWTQSAENSMVGIMSAVAALLALGRKGGLVWGLVSSIAGSLSKGKTPDYTNIMRVLTGLSLGFALGVVLSFAGSYWALPLGVLILVVTWVMERNKKKKQQAEVPSV